MNIYDLKLDSAGAWVRFFSSGATATWPSPDKEAVFFKTHARLDVTRNNEHEKTRQRRQLGDYSNINYDVHPVFSTRAKEVLAPCLAGLGQWIELVSEHDPTYWLFYITNVVDALDESKSEVVRFTNSTKVMAIDRYVFKPEAVRDQWLFTLPQRPGSNRLVTDRFVDLVQRHELTGFHFEKLWSDEPQQAAAVRA